ncbi:MAG TPA: tyrosine-type recombinase/integrase [Thermoanaerobaculia bacterium]
MKGRIPGFSYNPKKHLAHFSLYVPKTNGKLRRERSVHAESREEAIRLWQAFRDEISGKPPAPEPVAQPRAITFGAFITEYLEKICARRAKKTLAIYRTIAFTRLIPHFGEKPLDTIRSCDVEDFMATILSECSPAYVNNCARTMKALINHAVKRQLIAASPLTERIRFEDVPLPELELNDGERLAFLGAFDDEHGFQQDIAKRCRDAHVVTSEHFKAPRKFGFAPNLYSDSTHQRFERFLSLKPIFVVAIETGLRKMDLLNLEWTQVDLDGGFIRLLMKKTKKWAVVPISTLCRTALEECRARQVVSRHVFVNRDGTRVAEIALRRAFLRAKRVAGITRRFRFHDLRHTAACTLASAGVSLQVIQKILGHTSSRMTERYVRVNDAAVAEARCALDARNAKLGVTLHGEKIAALADASK